MHVQSTQAEKDNSLPILDSLSGKSIRIPLTYNPYWRKKAQAQLDALRVGDRVEARVQYSKHLKAPVLLEADWVNP